MLGKGKNAELMLKGDRVSGLQDRERVREMDGGDGNG